MNSFMISVFMGLLSANVNARPLTELEVQVVKTQVCRNNDDTILRSLDISDMPSQPTCKYDTVYCRTGDSKTLRRVSGERVYIRDCNIKGALKEAVDRLWNQCGGVLSTRCIKPADCYGVDRNGYESSIGSYTMPDEVGR